MEKRADDEREDDQLEERELVAHAQTRRQPARPSRGSS